MNTTFKWKDLPELLKKTYKEWSDDEAFDLSAIVAYYSVFSLPALLIIIITIAGALFEQEAVQGQISGEIGKMLGKDAGNEIQTMVKNSYVSNNGIVAMIVGIGVLLFGATGVFIALQKALNRIWDVKPDPNKSGILKLLLDRVTSLGMILVIGFLLLISLVISAMLSVLQEWLIQFVPEWLVIVFQVLNFMISFLVISVLFAALFKYLPDVKIPWRVVWKGAVITAFLFVIGKFALSLYFGKAEPGSTYGAAGSVILILLWVSYSSLILFFGAEFTQVYADYIGENIVPSEHAKPASEK
jgi:membrane protein